MTKCAEWLKLHLAAGKIPCDDVKEAAAAAGFTRKELQAARVELGIISTSVVSWSLPQEAQE